jgi:hypothetical protein
VLVEPTLDEAGHLERVLSGAGKRLEEHVRSGRDRESRSQHGNLMETYVNEEWTASPRHVHRPDVVRSVGRGYAPWMSGAGL